MGDPETPLLLPYHPKQSHLLAAGHRYETFWANIYLD